MFWSLKERVTLQEKNIIILLHYNEALSYNIVNILKAFLCASTVIVVGIVFHYWLTAIRSWDPSPRAFLCTLLIKIALYNSYILRGTALKTPTTNIILRLR